MTYFEKLPERKLDERERDFSGNSAGIASEQSPKALKRQTRPCEYESFWPFRSAHYVKQNQMVISSYSCTLLEW